MFSLKVSVARNIVEKPEQTISLDFPIVAAKQLFKAKVVFWIPVNTEKFAEDIAGLELQSSFENLPNLISDSIIKPGDRGSAVISLQERLQAAGFYNGKLTGEFDPITEEAVKTFLGTFAQSRYCQR
jgi:hypothetical protein